MPTKRLHTPPYAAEAIQQGDLLEYAQPADVDAFFAHRMANKPRKALVGAWFILYENNDFVYWGSPYFRSLWSGQRVVDSFYKTSQPALEAAFPSYKTLEGFVLRQQCRRILEDFTPNNNQFDVFVPKLEDSNICVHCAVGSAFYTILFDHSLNLISIHQSSKT